MPYSNELEVIHDVINRMVDRKAFKFELTNKKYLTFNSKEVKTDLARWDLNNRICLTTFSYNDFFKDYQAKDFTHDFFNDPNVQLNLKVNLHFSNCT
jgi:ribosomal protein S24E